MVRKERLEFPEGFKLPDWAELPSDEFKKSVFEVYKGDEWMEDIPLGRSKTKLFGRNGNICDAVLMHGSISRQHAAVVNAKDGPYLIDIYSSHGTYLNKEKVPKGVPILLKEGDKVKFGDSSRRYFFKKVGKERKRNKRLSKETLSNDLEEAKKLEERAHKKVKKDVETVHCLHILAKHTKSRKPSSWKEKVITRTLEEAKEKISDIRKKIIEKGNGSAEEMEKIFSEIASKESDCSSARRGGDLGKFGRGKMQKSFEEASFKLKVGELSDLVESQSGVHIIFRTK